MARNSLILSPPAPVSALTSRPLVARTRRTKGHMNTQPGSRERIYAIVAGALVCLALGLQFYLTSNLIAAQGRHWVQAILVFLDYFTILTNLLVAAALLLPAAAPTLQLATFFRRPAVLGAIATYIAVVGLGYTLLLLDFRASDGPSLWADVLLHDLSPILFVLYWLLFVPKGFLRWFHPFLWLGYPFLYVVYAFLRATITHRYPYPFLDIAALGHARVFHNIVLLAGGFLLVGLLMVALDRLLSMRKPAV